jgi:hypothetical protein
MQEPGIHQSKKLKVEKLGTARRKLTMNRIQTSVNPNRKL